MSILMERGSSCYFLGVKNNVFIFVMGRRSIRRVRGGLGKLRGVRPLRFWARRGQHIANNWSKITK